MRALSQLFLFGLLAVFSQLSSCTFSETSIAKDNKSALSGYIRMDGSSTVFPIGERAAERFGREHPQLRITVGVSGTGGGFKKFLHNEIDIVNASRKIKDSEVSDAHKNKIAFTEFDVAFDGLSIVVNKKNDFVKELSLEQLKAMWAPNSKVKTWKDLDSKWPATPIKLYGPGTDSGTFDYFTEHVNGKSGASRSDYTASEDDNVIVKGVSADKNGLGYFGYAYYEENKNILKVVPIKKDSKSNAVLPNPDTIRNNTYPISRPLFIYVNNQSIKKNEVKQFLQYLFSNAEDIVNKVGFISLGEMAYKNNIQKLGANMDTRKVATTKN